MYYIANGPYCILYVVRSFILRLDDQLQRISEDLEKTGAHSPYLEDVQGADIDIHHPGESADAMRFKQDVLKSDVWSLGSESTRGKAPRKYNMRDDKQDRGRRERSSGKWKRDMDWGWDGKRAYDQQERGYGRGESGRWRRDYGGSERSRFRPRERAGDRIVRLDSSTITTEAWNTPLPRNTEKEK